MNLFLFLLEQRGNGAFDMSNSCLEERNFLKRARSLLVISASPPSPTQYEVFTKKVLEFTSKDPFRFPTPSVFKNVSYVKASIYLNPFVYNNFDIIFIIIIFSLFPFMLPIYMTQLCSMHEH